LKASASAALSACLVCFVTFLGISAGQAEALPPAVISPLAQAPDPIVAEALAAVTEVKGGPAPAAVASYDPAPTSDPATTWLAMASGGMHACGIKADGTLACWGDNGFGQTSPPQGQFVKVTAGLVHSCAIRLDGKLLCWGADGARPTKTPKGRFKDVSAGDAHTCALRSNGAIKCWGASNFRQLKAPRGRFESLNAGGQHTCAVRIDGRATCWGEQSFMAYERPKGRFKAVATGETHACALRDDDRIACWGNDAYGQTQAPEGAFKHIAAGNFHTCGLRFDGSTVCWGRNDSGVLGVPAGEIFQALAAGGAHACGLRQDQTLNCWGSLRNEMSGVRPLLSAGLQSFPFQFLTQVTGFLGTGLVNYGKGVDQKWSKAESRAIKFQYGFMAVSLIMSALQFFLPQPPDPVVEALKRIEADLQELKAAVSRIESAIKQVDGKLTVLACNVSLQPLEDYGTKVQTAQDVYSRLLDSSQAVLKAYADRAQDPNKEVPDINPKIQTFIGDYEKDLRQALNAIQEALVPAISSKTSPLEDCMVKSFEQWKSAAKTPFDDRHYYQSIYEILGYALVYQNMALTMLQNIDLWHAQQMLNDGKVDYSPGDMVGYCAIVREKANSGDTKSAYWQQALSYCDEATDLTNRTYTHMVAQIERAGAPYSNEDMVLSLGSKILGKGPEWANRSWLWVRDVAAYGNTSDWNPNAPIPASTNQDKTKDFLYYPWKPDGQAWQTVASELTEQMRGREQDYPTKDLPTLMRDMAGFRSIIDRVFWMGDTTFSPYLKDLASSKLKCNTAGFVTVLAWDRNISS
jgi:alpha-tubulin suppressor-like RCC1 family protein